MKLAPVFAGVCCLFAAAACGRKPATNPEKSPPPVSKKETSEGSGPCAPPPLPGTGKTELPPDDPDPMSGLKVVASLPEEYYGKWQGTGSSGSLTGDGDGRPHDETIVITKENKFETWKGGKLESTIAFRAGRGRSIFGNDTLQISRGGFPDVIELKGDVLTISENHPDGINWSYQRAK